MPDIHDPKTRPLGFYWVLIRKSFYSYCEELEGEILYSGEIVVAQWMHDEWYFCGEEKPRPETDIGCVVEVVSEPYPDAE